MAAVSGVSPTSGSTNGTTWVTITGSNFLGATAVTFGGIPAISFVVNSATSITALGPEPGGGDGGHHCLDAVGVVQRSVGGRVHLQRGDAAFGDGPEPDVGQHRRRHGGHHHRQQLHGRNGRKLRHGGCRFSFVTDGVVIATAPAQAAGTVDVTVVSDAGTSATSSADEFTYSAASGPAVTAVTPNSGSTNGGDTVTITGSGFSGATAVTFGSTAAPAFTVLSDTTIVATAPAESAATIDITVTTPSGTSTTGSSDHYTFTSPSAPTVTGLNVSSGPDGGGTVVTITGTNFQDTSAVSFGGVAAASWYLNSSTQITAVAPPQAAATVDITVTTPAGTSATSSSDHYTYTSVGAPTVTVVSPNAGPTAGGNTVAITGTHFDGVTSVMFGSTAATSFTIESDTSIFAVAPAGSAGTVDVTLTDSDGTSTTSSADDYTFTAAPTITSLSSSSDTATGGTPITITGTNLTGTYVVYFGNVPSTEVIVTSSTSIIAFSPAQAAGDRQYHTRHSRRLFQHRVVHLQRRRHRHLDRRQQRLLGHVPATGARAPSPAAATTSSSPAATPSPTPPAPPPSTSSPSGAPSTSPAAA